MIGENLGYLEMMSFWFDRKSKISTDNWKIEDLSTTKVAYKKF